MTLAVVNTNEWGALSFLVAP